MSSHTYYQALPEQSGLFQGLRDDPAFHALFAHLTIRGPGPFHLAALEAGEIKDVLDALTGREATFASRAEADRAMTQVRREVKQALAAHPGLAGRGAYFEQVEEDLERLLAQELQRMGYKRAESLAATLLYGEAPLSAGATASLGLQFRLVPVQVVREGARVLQGLSAEALDSAAGDWEFPAEDYERWQAVYRVAASRGEVVIVLSA